MCQTCALMAAHSAKAQDGVFIRHQLEAGIGLANTSAMDGALDGPGLRLAYRLRKHEAFVGILADAQSGFGKAHFAKDTALALLLKLGSGITKDRTSLRPSLRFGAGRAVQHDEWNRRAMTFSPILGLGLEFTHVWFNDWSVGFDLDARAYLVPLNVTTSDTSSSWLLTEFSGYFMFGHEM